MSIMSFAQRLLTKYGIATPMAPEDDEPKVMSAPLNCSEAAKAGMGWTPEDDRAIREVNAPSNLNNF